MLPCVLEAVDFAVGNQCISNGMIEAGMVAGELDDKPPGMVKSDAPWPELLDFSVWKMKSPPKYNRL